jgi:hypothetical protein
METTQTQMTFKLEPHWKNIDARIEEIKAQYPNCLPKFISTILNKEGFRTRAGRKVKANTVSQHLWRINLKQTDPARYEFMRVKAIQRVKEYNRTKLTKRRRSVTRITPTAITSTSFTPRNTTTFSDIQTIFQMKNLSEDMRVKVIRELLA